MPVRLLTSLVWAALLVAPANHARAQSQAPGPEVAAQIAQAAQPAPPARPPQPPPKKAGQLVNIRTEFTITDQRGTGAAVKRIVSVIVADGDSGSIRSLPEVSDGFGKIQLVQLNVDVKPEVLTGGKVRLGFSVQYDGPSQLDAEATSIPRGTIMKSNLRQSVSVIVEDGKSIMVAQSADPIGDRQVTLDVKATIMK